MFYFLNLAKDENSALLAIKSSFYKVLLVSLVVGLPVLVLTILTQLFVGGITFSIKAIEWKSTKLNPIEYIKRTFSIKGLVELLKSILKVVLLFGCSLYVLYLNRYIKGFKNE